VGRDKDDANLLGYIPTTRLAANIGLRNPLMKTTPPNLVGTVLLVSRDEIASRQVADAMQQLAVSVEVCVDISAAADRLSRRKFEGVVIDLALGGQGTVCLEHVRVSALNQTAIIFTLTSSSEETAHALKAGSSFVLQRPLTSESIGNTLKVAYGFIMRERRRYFRYPVVAPVVLNRKMAPPVFGQTVNVSELGMALRTLTPLAPGSEGTVQFTLPDPLLRITGESKVCWNNEKGEVGLSFHFLPFDCASQLQSWLAQKLEKQLHQLVTDRFRESVGAADIKCDISH